MQNKSKLSLDYFKLKVKKAFVDYDEKKSEEEGHRKGMISREELCRLLSCIMKKNNNHNELLIEFDEDRDGFLTVDEMLKLIVAM